MSVSLSAVSASIPSILYISSSVSSYIFAARLRCASVVARRGFPDTNAVSVGGSSRQPVHTNPGEGQATSRHSRGLAAARSRCGSDNHSGCHSLPHRRFATRAAGVTVCGTKPSAQYKSVTLRAGDSACFGFMLYPLRCSDGEFCNAKFKNQRSGATTF